ncbi:MAG: acyl-phosphate glycerol 3-phosphate acyltransferase [Opitutus sp.]|nr:acyl-phosphate glycerol 3-phosphate acyltransferase [Opitutus sp.]
MSNFWIITTAVAGYLLGALPFGYLVARAHGVDIFKVGSGNPGATNVKRVLGEKFGAKGRRAGNLVFALDALKGAVATGWPLWFRHSSAINETYFPSESSVPWHVLPLIGVVAAVLGHSFSVFTRFKGGKGVATAAGGLVVLLPVACAIAAGVWVLTFYATRYVSLGSILGAVAVIVASWLLDYHVAYAVIATVLAGFVILRHHTNIRRLLGGTEAKFTPAADKKPDPQS